MKRGEQRHPDPAANAALAWVERLDEYRASRRRMRLGQRRWLVSWSIEGDSWLARMSCPEWPSTIESQGPSRCTAIDRAERLLTLLISGRNDVPV